MKHYVILVREPQAPQWQQQIGFSNLPEDKLEWAMQFIKSKGMVFDHKTEVKPLTSEDIVSSFKNSVKI